MVLAKLQLGGILDRDDALVIGDARREDVEERGLAGTGTARHEDVQPGFDAYSKELEHFGRGRPEPDQVLDRVRRGRELPDGDDRTDQRQWLDDRVHARAIGQAGIDSWARLVDAPPHRRDDPIDDPQHVLVVQEGAVDALDLSGPLDVDVARAIDHDFRDRSIRQERLERPQARDFRGQLLDQPHTFVAGDGEPVQANRPVDDPLDFSVEVSRIGDVEQGVEGADHLVLEAKPDVAKQLVPSSNLNPLRLSGCQSGRRPHAAPARPVGAAT